MITLIFLFLVMVGLIIFLTIFVCYVGGASDAA